MKYLNTIWFTTFFLLLLACRPNSVEKQEDISTDSRAYLNPDFIPADKIIHKGILSQDGESFYLTISDSAYQKFDILFSELKEGTWTTPVEANFNSNFSDHGMSFSPDGQWIYFSSTRPTGIDSIPSTWHLWRSEKEDNSWGAPSYIHISNLSNKLLSHPSVSEDNTLYFHSSDLDYSNMDLFQVKADEDGFSDARKVMLGLEEATNKCTPFVDPKGRFLLFAEIGEGLNLQISYRLENGGWDSPTDLPANINQYGQGNPFVDFDRNILIYTTSEGGDWALNQVSTEPWLKR